MTHQDVLAGGLLEEAPLGGLLPKELRELLEHCSVCPECADSLKLGQGLAESLKAYFAQEEASRDVEDMFPEDFFPDLGAG